MYFQSAFPFSREEYRFYIPKNLFLISSIVVLDGWKKKFEINRIDISISGSIEWFEKYYLFESIRRQIVYM